MAERRRQLALKVKVADSRYVVDEQQLVRIPQEVPEEQKSRLTIYSSSGHMVERHPPSTTSVTVPKSILLDSIVAIDSNGNVVPFSFVSELNTAMGLTDRVTGKRLEVTVMKGDKTISGEV